jgi:hypothetical protein
MKCRTIIRVLNEEQGHGVALPGVLLGGAGAILLGIGAANDSGLLAIIGGVVLAVGLLAASLLAHIGIEYGIFSRLDELEKR